MRFLIEEFLGGFLILLGEKGIYYFSLGFLVLYVLVSWTYIKD